MAYTFKSINNFMLKNGFTADQIRYISRKDERSILHLMDGRLLSTSIPLAYFDSYLGSADFSRINKSVLISNSQVVNVNGGIYLMTDGEKLEGRHRHMKEHSDFMVRMAGEQCSEEETGRMQQLRDKFQVFDDFPVPYCLIQLVFDVQGKSTDFIVRYCNRAMSKFGRLPLELILDRSFYDVFENNGDKWLVCYGDIAKNGGLKLIRGYKEKLNRRISVLCYQVTPGYCGCLIIPDGWQQLLSNKVVEFD